MRKMKGKNGEKEGKMKEKKTEKKGRKNNKIEKEIMRGDVMCKACVYAIYCYQRSPRVYDS